MYVEWRHFQDKFNITNISQTKFYEKVYMSKFISNTNKTILTVQFNGMKYLVLTSNQKTNLANTSKTKL